MPRCFALLHVRRCPSGAAMRSPSPTGAPTCRGRGHADMRPGGLWRRASPTTRLPGIGLAAKRPGLDALQARRADAPGGLGPYHCRICPTLPGPSVTGARRRFAIGMASAVSSSSTGGALERRANIPPQAGSRQTVNLQCVSTLAMRSTGEASSSAESSGSPFLQVCTQSNTGLLELPSWVGGGGEG